MKKAILITLFNLLHFITYGQRQNIDSMYALIKNAKDDTSKVNHLNNLAYAYRNSKPDSTIIFCKQSITLCEKIARTSHLKL